MYKRRLFKIALSFTAFNFSVLTIALGNVNAIDFKKVNYPKHLQDKIDFLRANDNVYNHWVHQWISSIPKNTVIENLQDLYNNLDQAKNKNAEEELLLGDIAHYLYNIEIDVYYEKAVDHYSKAINMDPKDYRVYWFLGNHYALSAKQVLSIQTYKKALQYLPAPIAHELFWADYAIACLNSGMYGTSAYAAHKASEIVSKKSFIENEIAPIVDNALKSPPLDTTISAKDMWSFGGKKDNLLIFNNWILGTKIAIDSTWNMDLGAFDKRKAYLTFKHHTITAKNGHVVDYSILILASIPEANESLQQYLDKFTARYNNRQPADFVYENLKDVIGYEIRDPSIYKNAGGGHMYALAFERDRPAFPGMLLETPSEIPSNGEKEVTYYKTNRTLGRLNSRLYYLILLDSCELINKESLADFTDFVKNGLLVE